MAFAIPKENYAGKIKVVTIGKGDKAVQVGGYNSMPLSTFEGEWPNKPVVAMEVYDIAPTQWAPAVVEPFKDVLDDPGAWAKKCVEYGAELIVVQLAGTDPNGANRSAADAVETVKAVKEAVDVPLIIWGSGNLEKDQEVLPAIMEAFPNENFLLGPAEEGNYKKIAASAIGYGHSIVAKSSIDVNLAKQLNILCENLGLPLDRIVMDPTTGALGYGIEYTYSVMERISLAALAQNDEKMQLPFVNDLAKEAWKTREAMLSIEEEPTFGDQDTRGILMETITALDVLTAGSSVLIMRNPKSVSVMKELINELYA
jgi:acetyl-CoA decarbonylase/synthase complex subunit delta